MILPSLACVLPQFKRTRQEIILWTGPGTCERNAPRQPENAAPLYPNPDGDPLCEEHKVHARDTELWAAREIFRRAMWNKPITEPAEPVDLLCTYPFLLDDELVFCEAPADESLLSNLKRPLCETHAFAREDKELWKELETILMTRWRTGLRLAEEEHQEWLRTVRVALARNPEPKPVRIGTRKLRRDKRCVVPLCVDPRVEGDRCRRHGKENLERLAHARAVRLVRKGAMLKTEREFRRHSHTATFTRLVGELEDLKARGPKNV